MVLLLKSWTQNIETFDVHSRIHICNFTNEKLDPIASVDEVVHLKSYANQLLNILYFSLHQLLNILYFSLHYHHLAVTKLCRWGSLPHCASVLANWHSEKTNRGNRRKFSSSSICLIFSRVCSNNKKNNF